MAAKHTNLVCPFFATPIIFWPTPIGWFATADTRDGSGWASPLFPSEAKLIEALSPRASVPTLPLVRPLMTCPFTGVAVEVVPEGEGLFAARVEGLWASRPLLGMRRLEYMMSTRNGVPPLFEKSESSGVVVGEVRSPPVPVENMAPEGSGNVREEVERMVFNAGGGSRSIVVDGLKPSSRLHGKRSK